MGRDDSLDCPERRPACDVGCNAERSLQTIKEFVCGNGRLQLLCFALQDASLDELLDENGTFTLFAPTNSAFEKLGEANVEELIDDPAGKLRNVLLYHVSNEIYFSKDLECDGKIDTE